VQRQNQYKYKHLVSSTTTAYEHVICRRSFSNGRAYTCVGVTTKVCGYVHVHSRSISFFSWCFSHRPVGDPGQPVSVWSQDQLTEPSRVNARCSELLDLRDLYGRRSSSLSKSLEYSITNVRINTASNISSGRSINVYNINITTFIELFSWYFLSDLLCINFYTNVFITSKLTSHHWVLRTLARLGLYHGYM